MPIPLDRLWIALVAVVGVPAVMVGYVALAERIVALLAFKARGAVRPWLWVGPALMLLALYLIYPTINTFYLSLFNYDSTRFVGLDNYVLVLTGPQALEAIRNNAFWLALLTGFTVTFGLLIAVLFDRVRYQAAAKAIVFIPMAISFVAAGVIWKVMYDYQPPGRPQTGTLNAVVTAVGHAPLPWLIDRSSNNPALVQVSIWMWTGFAMVILSAELKVIPMEIIEAARVDGANEIQILQRIIVPMLVSTIAVVATTMIIFALKALDVIYVLTSGNFGIDVMANLTYEYLFAFRDIGVSNAIAAVLLIAIVPVMAVNIRRFQEQEALR